MNDMETKKRKIKVGICSETGSICHPSFCDKCKLKEEAGICGIFNIQDFVLDYNTLQTLIHKKIKEMKK